MNWTREKVRKNPWKLIEQLTDSRCDVRLFGTSPEIRAIQLRVYPQDGGETILFMGHGATLVDALEDMLSSAEETLRLLGAGPFRKSGET